MRKLMVAVSCAVILAGCVSTSATTFDNVRRQPTTGNIEIHTDRSNIKRPYKEIGLVTVDDGEAGAWGIGNDNALLQKAMEQARAMGADGLLVSFDSSARTFGNTLSVNTVKTKIVRGVAFVYEK